MIENLWGEPRAPCYGTAAVVVRDGYGTWKV